MIPRLRDTSLLHKIYSLLCKPYVAAEPCIDGKHTDCVVVCPVDCFHEGPTVLPCSPMS